MDSVTILMANRSAGACNNANFGCFCNFDILSRKKGVACLSIALVLLAGPIGILDLIATDAWPMIPVAVLWPSIAFLIVGRIAIVILGAMYRCIVGYDFPFDSRRRLSWESVWLPTVVLSVIVATLFIPAVFAAFYFGEQSGLAVFLLIGAAWPVHGWIAGRALRKKEEVRAADEERMRAWQCPHCGEAFGPDALLVQYGALQNDLRPETDRRHAILRCANCRYGYVFNVVGGVLMELGNEWRGE